MNSNITPTREQARLSIATNAIGWELYYNDGRPRHLLDDDDGNETIVCTETEIAIAERIARRVIDRLDKFDQR